MANAKSYKGNTLAQDAVNIFGGGDSQRDEALASELRSGRKERIEQIDIFHILPDPTQPRRAMPSSVRSLWKGQPEELNIVFSQWWGAAQHEIDADIPLPALVQSGDPDDREYGMHGQSLLALVGLAASIRKDGLTNAPTVWRDGDVYRLETGERRWLAYHLLWWLEQDQRWAKMPVRIVERPNVWRQAAENGARQDLNAIARARQFAILLMALHEGQSFRLYEACASDRGYYAQALDLRVPHGKSSDLLAAMGLTNRSALSDYRTVLGIDDELWQIADDENWSVRKLLGAPNNSPDGDTHLSDRPTPSATKPTFWDKFTAESSVRRKKFERYVKRMKRAGQGDKQKFAQILDDEIAHLQRLREQIGD